MIQALQLVLRATLHDGSVVEGTMAAASRSIYDTEDAYVFFSLNNMGEEKSRTYDEVLAALLLSQLQRQVDAERKPDGSHELPLELSEKLRERNDPPPP